MLRDLINRLFATGNNKPHKRRRVDENQRNGPSVDVSGPLSEVVNSLKQKISDGASPRGEFLIVVLYYLEEGVSARLIDSAFRQKIDALRASERTRFVQYVVSEL